MPVDVYTSVCMCVFVHARAHAPTNTCAQRPEVDFGCSPQALPILSLWAKSHTELEAH